MLSNTASAVFEHPDSFDTGYSDSSVVGLASAPELPALALPPLPVPALNIPTVSLPALPALPSLPQLVLPTLNLELPGLGFPEIPSLSLNIPTLPPLPALPSLPQLILNFPCPEAEVEEKL